MNLGRRPHAAKKNAAGTVARIAEGLTAGDFTSDADAAQIKGLMRRTAEDAETIGGDGDKR